MQTRTIILIIFNTILCFTMLLLFFACDEFNLYTLFTKDTEAKVITPALDNLYYKGGDIIIEWEKIAGEKVRIDLYREDELIKTIADSTENDDEHLWTIPAEQQISDNYYIKIIILDYPPYSGDSFDSGRFFIDNNSWEELPPVETVNAYDVSIALGTDKYPAIVFSDYYGDKTYKKARFLKWDHTNSLWEGDYLSINHSNYYSVAIDSNNIPYIAYTEGMLETRVKKWENGILEDCGLVHPFLNVMPDYFIIGASIAIDQNDNPVVSYMGFSLMNLLIKEKSYFLFTSVLEGSDWSTYSEIRYMAEDGAIYIHEDELLNHPPPYYIDGDSLGVINSFDLMALFKLYFLPLFDEDTIIPTGDPHDYVAHNMEIPLYTSIVIDNDNLPVVAYLNLHYEPPLWTRKQVHIHHFNRDDGGNVTDGTWHHWKEIKSPLNEGDADFQAIAIGPDNIPVIVYKDNSNGEIARVKKWDNLSKTWVFLGSPGSCTDGVKPAIVIDKYNNPIVACKNGVKRWNGSEWVCLGFPNQPGNGYGHHTSWLAVNDDCLAVAYIKSSDRDKVYVKMLAIEKYTDNFLNP